MRLIDADALIAEFNKRELEPYYQHDGEDWYVGLISAEELVWEAPTIELERKRGKWGNHGECPFCGYLRQWEDDKFCGNCGADMRGD